jgi:hypothetical protein
MRIYRCRTVTIVAAKIKAMQTRKMAYSVCSTGPLATVTVGVGAGRSDERVGTRAKRVPGVGSGVRVGVAVAVARGVGVDVGLAVGEAVGVGLGGGVAVADGVAVDGIVLDGVVWVGPADLGVDVAADVAVGMSVFVAVGWTTWRATVWRDSPCALTTRNS